MILITVCIVPAAGAFDNDDEDADGVRSLQAMILITVCNVAADGHLMMMMMMMMMVVVVVLFSKINAFDYCLQCSC